MKTFRNCNFHGTYEKEIVASLIEWRRFFKQDKWQPLHTLAASGEFYLVDTLMKYNVDINVPNQVKMMTFSFSPFFFLLLLTSYLGLFLI